MMKKRFIDTIAALMLLMVCSLLVMVGPLVVAGY